MKKTLCILILAVLFCNACGTGAGMVAGSLMGSAVNMGRRARSADVDAEKLAAARKAFADAQKRSQERSQ